MSIERRHVQSLHSSFESRSVSRLSRLRGESRQVCPLSRLRPVCPPSLGTDDSSGIYRGHGVLLVSIYRTIHRGFIGEECNVQSMIFSCLTSQRLQSPPDKGDLGGCRS